ncbi:MAG TPA: hypothetical protein VKX39_02110 [Bryobacteraceae bacterium]|jgi:hypothetical protein|nr:hypothetical protein [Bryobacteraceae bacterium]
MIWARLLILLAPFAAAQSLDFEVYRTKVEPIFLKKRPTHARCVACHVEANTAFRLQPLPEDAKGWSEEASRKNFAVVSNLVVPGDPDKSRLLHHPLAHEAGGDVFHGGGRQFRSKDDPDYRTIADWIRAAKPSN